MWNLLVGPALRLRERGGSEREQNQGFAGVFRGDCWLMAVTPKMVPDLRLYRSKSLEAATGIEPVYRALQALA
jgi:hypothetical protein